VARRLVGADVAVMFAPAYRAKWRTPDTLEQWLHYQAPLRQRDLAAMGHTAELIPTVVLEPEWLTDPSLRAVAINAIATVDGPVAVFLTAIISPMLDPDAVAGMVDLVATAGNVIVVRSDEAAIGLTANGALLATVGTSSTARFSYLGSRGKNRRPPHHDVFHLPTLTFISNDRLSVFSVPSDDADCPCHVCNGRTIRRFHDNALEVESIAHSMACLHDLHQRVHHAGTPATAWIDECVAAEETADRLRQRVPSFVELGQSARTWTTALNPTV
jgi:hypothetical protein